MLSRKEVISLLVTMSLLVLLSSAALAVKGEALDTVIDEYNQAPMLQEMVDAGEISDVEDRLPKNPMVIEPWHEIGEYGGTWHRFSTSQDWIFWANYLYDWSLVRWTKDSTEIAPNIVVEWDSNEEKTSWTFHLREGAKWSDGEAITTEDIRFWWEDMAQDPGHAESIPEWGRAPNGERMELNIVDDYTFQMNFAVSSPLLLERLAIWCDGQLRSYTIAPSHYLKQFHPRYSDEYDDYVTVQEKDNFLLNPEVPVLSAWMLVEEEVGERVRWERNPYYWVVDTAGNQLPYIDEVDMRYVADAEVMKLRVMEGQADLLTPARPDIFSVRELPLVLQSEERGNYRTIRWGGGSGAVFTYYPNREHQDPDKKELYNTPEFNRALSHALNRQEMIDTLYFGEGYPTTGTYHPAAIEYRRTEEGREMFEKWRDSYVEYDPEKAGSLLDEIGVVDQTGDGWRDLPNGESLVLRIDMSSGARDEYFDINEMTQEFWQDVGLNTEINTVAGAQLGIMDSEQTYDILGNRGNEEGHDNITFPVWLAPFWGEYWEGLKGQYFALRHDPDLIEAQLDRDPRDREPPFMVPEPGSAVDRLQKLMAQAMEEPDSYARDQLVFDMIDIHIEEGPFWIGTVGTPPASPGIVKNNFHNVPYAEELEWGGRVYPWTQSYPGQVLPAQYFMTEE